MAKLLHEIWVEDTSFGAIPSIVLAGPDGDAFRQGLASGARLVLTFEAEDNFEAMTAFYRYNGWGPYQLNLPDDQKPFPASWRDRQGIPASVPPGASEAPPLGSEPAYEPNADDVSSLQAPQRADTVQQSED